MLSKFNRKYNLVKQVDDARDFKISFEKLGSIPNKVDLRSKCPPIFDQGNLGSCSANAGVAARMMLTNINTMLSRLDLYYEERALEGTIGEDSGAQMRDICKALNQSGVCEETYFPYLESTFTNAPSKDAVANAQKYKINSYKALSGVDQIKQYIAINQMPVLLGINVYESLESDSTMKTGIIPIPNATKEELLGGHAILLVGYIDDGASVRKNRNCKMKATATKSGGFFSWLIDLIFGSKTTDPATDITKSNDGYFILRNSWGTTTTDGKTVGDAGYFYLPYNYITKGYGFDSWVISM